MFYLLDKYIEEYDTADYQKLENHLVDKLRGYETGMETYQSPVKQALHNIDIRSLSALTQREKLQHFCSRIEGAWWQLLIEKPPKRRWWQRIVFSISFVQFEPDEVTNEVGLHGQTYDVEGKPLGRWESLAVDIVENERKIFYCWKARHPKLKESKGYGEFEFDQSDGNFNYGGGQFMNTDISDSPKSWKKNVILRRITEKQHIQIMTGRDDLAKKELTKKILEKLKNETTAY